MKLCSACVYDHKTKHELAVAICKQLEISNPETFLSEGSTVTREFFLEVARKLHHSYRKVNE